MTQHLITFDLDTNRDNAYYDIANILKSHGFNRIQGSVFLGEKGISEAHGTLALQKLTATYDWFYECVSNVRFYRIESDLDAQFILDNVHQAKQRFTQHLKNLKATLLENGLTELQIENILKLEEFSLEQLKN